MLRTGRMCSRRAGAKYVVPVAEHHDGFPMYDCQLTEWSAAAKMGPKRDVIGELATAVRKQGIHFAASSHRAEHWWFYDHGREFDTLLPLFQYHYRESCNKMNDYLYLIEDKQPACQPGPSIHPVPLF